MADTLMVRLVADLSGYLPGLRTAAGATSDFGTKAQTAADKAAKATASLAAAQRAAAQDTSRIAEAQHRLIAAQERVNTLNQAGTASAGQLAQANAALLTATRQLDSVQQGAADHIKQAAQAQDDLATATKDNAQAQKDSAVGSRLAEAGMAGLAVAAAAVGAELVATLHSAIEFDAAMRNVNSISGLSEKSLGTLSAQVIDLSNSLPQSATTLAEGLYDVASSGFQGAAGMVVLKAAAVSASAGMTDTATAAQAITAVLNAYHLSAADATDVSDTLFSTVNLGVTTFEQLAHNVGDYVGQAAALGAGFGQASSAIATLTLNGINAGEAGTVLGAILNALIKPSQGLATALHTAGFESGTAAVHALGLRGTLEKLAEQTGGSAEAMSGLFQDTTALRGALALTASSGETWNKVAGTIESKTGRAGAAQAALSEQMKSVSAQLSLLKNRVANIGIEAWQQVMPQAARGIGSVSEALSKVNDVIVAATPAILGFVHLFIGPLVDAASHLGPILGHLGELVRPLAVGLIGVVGVPIVAFLVGLAKALDATLGFLDRNSAVTKVLAVALSAYLAPALYRVVAGQVTAAAGWVAGRAAMIGATVASQGLTLGLTAVAAAEAAATLGVTAIIAAVGANVLALGRGAADAKKAVAGITTDVNVFDPTAVATARMQLGGYVADQQTAAHVGYDLTSVWHVLNGTALEHVRAFHAAQDALEAFNAKVAAGRSNVHQLGMAYGLSAEQVQKLAKANGIDLTGSFYDVNDALYGVISAQDKASTSAGGLTGAAALTAEQIKALDDSAQSLSQTIGSFLDPATIYSGLLDQAKTAAQDAAQTIADSTETTKDSWKDYAETATVSIDAFTRKLEQSNTDVKTWQDNLKTIAQRGQGDLAASLAQMGPQSATLVAAAAKSTDPELKRFAAAFKTSGELSSKQHAAALQAGLKTAADDAKLGGEKIVSSLTTALSRGTGTIKLIASNYAAILAAGVNPLLSALGQPPVGTVAAPGDATYSPTPGGKPILNANGNVFEQHTAQIAPAGAWRVWAEPETGGESYIPLAPAKRQRSVSIWKQTGRLLGQQVDHYADGGFASAADVPQVPSLAPYRGMLAAPGIAAMQAARGAVLGVLAAHAQPGAAPGDSSGPGGNAKGLTKHAQAVRAEIMGLFGVSNIGGYRPPGDGYDEHSTGRALDVMVGLDNPLGTTIANWAIKNAADIGLKWVIWQQAIYNASKGSWRHMADRGSPTQNHRDHDHIFLNQAKGGILNPHVRDAGGPLLPGFTYNGLNRPEMVLPFATGGIVASSLTGATVHATSAKAAPQSPAQAAAAAEARAQAAEREAAAEKKAADATAAHNDQIAKQTALREAQAKAAEAHQRVLKLEHDLTVVKTPAARADTQKLLADARTAERDAQAAVTRARAALSSGGGSGAQARADAARKEADAAKQRAANYAAAVEKQHQVEDNQYDLGVLSAAKYDALLAKRLSHEKKYTDAWVAIVQRRAQVAKDQADKQTAIEDNQYAVGALSTAAYLKDLNRRIAGEKAYTAEWLSDVQKRDQIIADRAEKARQAAQDAADAARTVADTAKDAYDTALGHLNDYLDSAVDLRKQKTAAQTEYDSKVAQSAADSAKLQKRYDQDVFDAQVAHDSKINDLLAGRRDSLTAWMKLDSKSTVGWGNTVQQLIDNAADQNAQLNEWMDRLGDLRKRGLSESVIGALGLDQGPQALAQLRSFATASTDQIDTLNTSWAARSTAATEQARREQVGGYSQLGRDLAAEGAAYAKSLADLQTGFADAQAQLQSDLDAAHADLIAKLGDLDGQLAQVGADTGRGYADAISEGIRSGIPGIIAAAQAAQAAAQALNAAQAAASQAASAVPPAAAAAPGAASAGTAAGITAAQRAAAAAVVASTLPKHTSGNDALIASLPPGQLTARQIAYAQQYGVKLRTYDVGGWLEPGLTLAYNGTGKRERILTHEQAAGPSNVQVRVFIGDRELTDIVDVQIGSTLGARRTAVTLAGAR